MSGRGDLEFLISVKNRNGGSLNALLREEGILDYLELVSGESESFGESNGIETIAFCPDRSGIRDDKVIDNGSE